MFTKYLKIDPVTTRISMPQTDMGFSGRVDSAPISLCACVPGNGSVFALKNAFTDPGIYSVCENNETITSVVPELKMQPVLSLTADYSFWDAGVFVSRTIADLLQESEKQCVDALLGARLYFSVSCSAPARTFRAVAKSVPFIRKKAVLSGRDRCTARCMFRL